MKPSNRTWIVVTQNHFTIRYLITWTKCCLINCFFELWCFILYFSWVLIATTNIWWSVPTCISINNEKKFKIKLQSRFIRIITTIASNSFTIFIRCDSFDDCHQFCCISYCFDWTLCVIICRPNWSSCFCVQLCFFIIIWKKFLVVFKI